MGPTMGPTMRPTTGTLFLLLVSIFSLPSCFHVKYNCYALSFHFFSAVLSFNCFGLFWTSIGCEESFTMDAKMWGSEITRSQMLQTTSQLEALQQVLHEPKEVDIKLVPEVHRSLSLVEEQDIASKLAFLSATTPSNLEVMAICFEEDSRGEDATIRLASNAGVSPTTTENFGKLAEILMLAASRRMPLSNLPERYQLTSYRTSKARQCPCSFSTHNPHGFG